MLIGSMFSTLGYLPLTAHEKSFTLLVVIAGFLINWALGGSHLNSFKLQFLICSIWALPFLSRRIHVLGALLVGGGSRAYVDLF